MKRNAWTSGRLFPTEDSSGMVKTREPDDELFKRGAVGGIAGVDYSLCCRGCGPQGGEVQEERSSRVGSVGGQAFIKRSTG